MTNGDKVIAAARTKLGCAESPPGSNSGPCVRQIQSSTGAYGQPWCGSFDKWSYNTAGVDDHGIASASTWQIVHNAQVLGRVRPEPVTGCMVVWRPGPNGHTELFIRWADRSRNLAWTIGGNTGDMVREHIRDVTGAYFCVPKSLEAVPVYATTYWWEDPAAKPVRHQLRNTAERREQDIAAWVARNGNPGHVRRGTVSIRRHGKYVPVFTWWTGPRKRSPDFTSKAARDASLKKAAAQTGHVLRPRSKRVRVS